MWLKNATIFGIAPKAVFNLEQLQAARFIPISSLELQSVGFSPVQGELAYIQGRHILLRFMIEKKHIPGSAVAVMVEEKAAAMEKEQGFPPGKKARKELKERVVDELLPRALATRRATNVWIDQDQHRIVIDSAASSVVDEIVKALLKVFGEIGLQDVSWPRAKVLTEWVNDEAPRDFTLDDSLVLQYPGAKGTVVKYERGGPGSMDVLDNLQRGAIVQSVAMTFASKVSFVMTDNRLVRKIKPLDILREAESTDEDRFAIDFALMTRELGCLVDALVQAA